MTGKIDGLGEEFGLLGQLKIGLSGGNTTLMLLFQFLSYVSVMYASFSIHIVLSDGCLCVGSFEGLF